METERPISNKTTFQNYLFLWLGQNFSYLGSAIVAFIIILQLAGGENYVLSVAAISSFGPSILFGALAGVIADRFDKKIIIIITDSLQAIATLALIILYYSPITVVPWHIYVILAFRGMCQAFHGPVVNALTPLMVPKEKLSRMNGIGYLISSV
ncbi:MAG: MFS transporter, partial [Promethearchaeota archaeon]